MLNIPRNLNDDFYRYKMPAAKIKYEGNGHRTRITNVQDIARAIRVPSPMLLKFLGYELGCQINLNNEIFKGYHSESLLNSCIDKFIDKYVLCPNCKYPELVLNVKGGVLSASCNACGKVSKLDNNHKVVKFVIKYPPTNLTEIASNLKHHHQHVAPSSGSGSSDNEEEKKKDDDFSKSSKSFIEIEGGLIETLKKFYKQFSEETEEIDDFDVVEIINIAKETIPKENQDKASYLLFNAIFDVNIAKNVKKNEPLLRKIFKAFKIKDAEIDILLNLEVFLFEKNSSVDFEKYIPTILKLFYDEKFLTEEFLINWKEDKLTENLGKDFRYEKDRDEKFKSAAKPFLDWISSAEESEDEDDDEQESD